MANTNRLKTMRKVKRLTQQELASKFNVTQNTYSYWENGKVNLDNATISNLAEFYGVSVDFLLGRKYELTIPISKWHRSLQEEYENGSQFLREYMEYKYGGAFFPSGTTKSPSMELSEEERALGLSDNHPIALSDDDRELINLFAEAEEKLGKTYVRGIKQMVRLHIDSKDKS